MNTYITKYYDEHCKQGGKCKETYKNMDYIIGG